MKLAVRAKALGKKLTLMTTAFVLAVSSLTALTPFVLAEKASAVAITGNVAQIYNATDLADAVADPAVKNLSIKASFTTSAKTVLSGRNMNIDGNGNTITFTNTPGWHGEYVFQAYKISLSVKNLTITGGDAAIYANGSSLTIDKSVDVSGNEFGGIEVSQGSGVTTPAKLNVLPTATLTNATEANGKPTAWTDDASTANATITGPFTKTTHVGGDQYQYYLDGVKAGIVATNTDTHETFASIQDAINDTDTTTGNTIALNQNVTLNSLSVRVTKSLTIDGNGKTVTTTFNRGAGGVSNAAFVVLASNTVIKDITVQGNGAGTSAAHGIVVQDSTAVTLENVLAKNNAAGVIVNGSTVTIDGIHTTGNNWYGVNIDKPGAHLTIKGANTHTESVALYADDKTIGLVSDVDAQYTTKDNVKQAGDRAYYLKSSAPTAAIAAPEFSKSLNVTVKGTATSSFGVKSHWFEITNPDNTLSYAHQMTATSDTYSFTLDTSKGSGEYKVRYVVTDNRGIRNDVNGSVTKTILVDTSDPVVTIHNVSLGIDKILHFSVSGTDTFSGARTVGVNIYDATNTNEVIAVGRLAHDVAPGTLAVGPYSRSIDVSGLTSGTYTIRAAIRDWAGNTTFATYLITVDNTPIAVTTGTFTATGNVITPNVVVDETPASQVWTQVSGPVGGVTISDPTALTPSFTVLQDGAYEFELTVVDASGNSSTGLFAFSYTTPVAPATNTGNNDGEGSGDDGDNTGFTGPAFISPATTDQLGANDEANTDGTPAVEGTSTEKNLAAAVNNTDGNAFGLAWYWWLLIVAGGATGIWWLIAAIRGRSAE